MQKRLAQSLGMGVVLALLALRPAAGLGTMSGMPVQEMFPEARFDPALPPIDTAVAALRFPSGALGTWATCYSARGRGPLLIVRGSEANAELHRERAVLRPAAGRESVYRSGKSSFEEEFRHFADVVQRGAPVAVTPADALADLELVAAIAKGTPPHLGDARRKP